MRIVLLGNDERAIALIRAALDRADGEGHELVWAGDLADRRHVLAAIPEAASVMRDDPETLGGANADVVVAAAAENASRRFEQLRLLAQSGVALCVTNPAALGPLDAYELDMIRAESEGPLIPWLPARLHPAISRLREWFDDSAVSPIGTIEQTVFERGVADFSPPAVLRTLAEDVDLCRALGGDVVRLNAVGAESRKVGTARSFAALSVHLISELGCTFRWEINRELAAGVLRITIIGSAGRTILTAANSVWNLSVAPTGPAQSHGEAVPPNAATVSEYEPWKPAEAVLDLISATVGGEKSKPDWLDAARAVDVADMVEVSLRRGRTVDIYNETYSEEATFKGVMGMAGCGLLLLSLVVVFAAAIGQKLARAAGWDNLAVVLGKWHYLLLAILVIFLALQLFQFAARRKTRGNDAATDAGGRREKMTEAEGD